MEQPYESYRTVIGQLPAATDVQGWLAAWEREVNRRWTASTRAHPSFRARDGMIAWNAFVKQMKALPDAGLPADDYRSDDITVVRRPSEARCFRTYRVCRRIDGDEAALN